MKPVAKPDADFARWAFQLARSYGYGKPPAQIAGGLMAAAATFLAEAGWTQTDATDFARLAWRAFSEALRSAKQQSSASGSQTHCKEG